MIAVDGQRSGHRCAGRGVGPRIGEQVGQHLVKPRLIAPHHDRFFGEVQRPMVIGTRDMCVACGIDDQTAEIHLFALQRPAGVKAREQQHVLDEVCHPLGLGLHPAHRVRDVVGQHILFALRQFGISANRRERGA